MPVTVIVSPFAYIAGAVMAKKKKLRSLLWAGWALTVGGLAAFSTLSPSSNLGEQIGWQVIVAGGVGFLYSTIALLCQAGQPDELQSIAINIFTFFRSLGQTFGIAVGGVVFQNKFGQEVADHNVPVAYRIPSRDTESAFAVIGAFPADVGRDYRQIYAKSLQTLWYTGVGVAAVALLTSLLVRSASLDRGMSSKQRFVSKRGVKEVEV
jgi:fucose permease